MTDARRPASVRGGVVLAATALSLSSFDSSALAQQPTAAPPTKEACGASYVEGQRLLREGALKRARERLLVCARDPCPSAFQPECVQWLAEVDRRTPTVIFEAKTQDGEDVADVRVIMDGVPLAARLEGREIEIEPGEHTLRFTRAGTPPIDKTVVVQEGVKARPVLVTFPSTQKPTAEGTLPLASPDAASRPVPWTVWLAGGVGVAALGTFAGFAIAGLAQHDTLNACKGGCAQSLVDSDRTKLQIADVSLGVAAVSLATAAILYFTRPNAQATTGALRLEPTVGLRSAGMRAGFAF